MHLCFAIHIFPVNVVIVAVIVVDLTWARPSYGDKTALQQREKVKRHQTRQSKQCEENALIFQRFILFFCFMLAI